MKIYRLLFIMLLLGAGSSLSFGAGFPPPPPQDPPCWPPPCIPIDGGIGFLAAAAAAYGVKKAIDSKKKG